MKFILGTATFGSNYGIANQGFEQSESKSIEILDSALRLGVTTVDTSPDYANAESIIGKYKIYNKNISVHTKISKNLPLSHTQILLGLKNSLECLQSKQIEIAYFHNPDMLFEYAPKFVNSIIDSVLDSGYVKNLGASVYSKSQILRIAEKYPKIKIFQVPENILDQRLNTSIYIDQLSKSGFTFYVRSIFLQGLLLMNPSKIPPHLAAANEYLDQFHKHIKKYNLSPLEASVGYLNELKWASGFLVGIFESYQIEEIVLTSKKQIQRIPLPPPLPSDLVDPRKWKKRL